MTGFHFSQIGGGDRAPLFPLGTKTATHNPLYFPSDTLALTFDYETTRASNDDFLGVYIGDSQIDVLALDSIMQDSNIIRLGGQFRNTVETIEFRLNAGGLGIDSDVLIDNVSVSAFPVVFEPERTAPDNPTVAPRAGNQSILDQRYLLELHDEDEDSDDSRRTVFQYWNDVGPPI